MLPYQGCDDIVCLCKRRKWFFKFVFVRLDSHGLGRVLPGGIPAESKSQVTRLRNALWPESDSQNISSRLSGKSKQSLQRHKRAVPAVQHKFEHAGHVLPTELRTRPRVIR
ncbi:uncharacterized protein LOC108091099 [Drosophila ficusphila]|uniref:uncharacterized protein LOC108091099 n=1 Tax=Drosophila ficusphila TaxID=30025 RepID=UPI0007E7BE2E|nr:uncharacterized protein LOC108091099 [Drosophila ficusphila]